MLARRGFRPSERTTFKIERRDILDPSSTWQECGAKAEDEFLDGESQAFVAELLNRHGCDTDARIWANEDFTKVVAFRTVAI